MFMREQRCKKKLTLAVVAERMGVSQPYVSDLELGKRNWNAKITQRFKEAVNR